MYKVIKTIETTDFGGKFTVSKVLVEATDGRQTEFYLRGGEDFAIIIPLLDAKTMVMVEQPRLGIGRVSLEFPMGQVAGAKNKEEIAKVELEEETGYTAGRLEFLGEFYPSPGWSSQKAQVFVGHDLIAGTPKPEPFEFITPVTVTIDQLKAKIARNEVDGMTTISAFMSFLEWYKKQ